MEYKLSDSDDGEWTPVGKSLYAVAIVDFDNFETHCTVSLAWMASESAMTTSPLVPTLAAALLWRYLHSLIEAVTSADGLPVGHISRPLLCQFLYQDQRFEPEHSVTSSSQEIFASDNPFILLYCKCDRFQSLMLVSGYDHFYPLTVILI